MANQRLLTSCIFEDEWFGRLPFFEQVVWIGLFGRCADDQGRFRDNALLLRAQLFPYQDVDVAALEGVLAAFASAGRIVRYQVEGKPYCQILKWWSHQRLQWAQPSRFPAPSGWEDRVRAVVGGKYVEEKWVKRGARGAPQAGEDGAGPAADAEQPVEKRIFRVYEEESGILLTPMIAEELKDMLATYPAQNIEDAIRVARQRGVNRLGPKYLRTVLEDWANRGRAIGNEGRTDFTGIGQR